MDKKAIVRYWVDTSDRDYKAMKNLFDSSDYHWGLFIGHLVLEKLLKAIYVQIINAGDLDSPFYEEIIKRGIKIV